jgi:prepilin-type N-terminal cleavage/methylation domain-containing protein
MISTPLRMNKLRARMRAHALARGGFTLIELMLVVSLIGIMSAISVPSVMRLMQDRRSQRDAMTLLVTLQDAHTRAFGRGGAVVMTIDTGGGSSPAVVGIAESTFDINGAAAGGGEPCLHRFGWQRHRLVAILRPRRTSSSRKRRPGHRLHRDQQKVFLFTHPAATLGRTALTDAKLDSVLTFELKVKGNSGITRKVNSAERHLRPDSDAASLTVGATQGLRSAVGLHDGPSLREFHDSGVMGSILAIGVVLSLKYAAMGTMGSQHITNASATRGVLRR